MSTEALQGLLVLAGLIAAGSYVVWALLGVSGPESRPAGSGSRSRTADGASGGGSWWASGGGDGSGSGGGDGGGGGGGGE
ncbi:hypothetical protein GCM10009716_15680 [Streptomyces sodiiphilus]|uniref:Uncharacterized protein n=1 Tax=Streptomyces sodiiphilus TaxID=226217 RepID=A0ABP5A835_9ACTN